MITQSIIRNTMQIKGKQKHPPPKYHHCIKHVGSKLALDSLILVYLLLSNLNVSCKSQMAWHQPPSSFDL
ncbi:hypothetical protein C1H46_002614 [Malus baccata]|uniref:Uncharacterized protein n=1 Tax=Malus baccata TaxID=106549 RepID=A0A540NL56_MALBA|nr:hypothetical protein C1H46_002614 [Malus baccata]